PHAGKHPNTKASWSSPRRATSRSVGRAGLVFVTTVRAVWFRERSSTNRGHSISPLTATFSFAAHNRLATSSSICEEIDVERGRHARRRCKRENSNLFSRSNHAAGERCRASAAVLYR